ncbi:MAG: hypothetical protein KBC66_08735 [Kiritimatiellae bacterium]|jgi:hypothetical protein|nr:hypothetical protein [Kiritimatiellia bacterium]NLD89845.1 hypothetical protein [Lentisphaerota bacterium]HPC19638.1 hypothetical protein [Kiritimatiellia bacterium]HQQ61663.1 hypothetical protein [Kiritimatiellia bacterium]
MATDEKQVYVKPSLTVVEVAARELLGTGPEPPEESKAMSMGVAPDVLTEGLEGY